VLITWDGFANMNCTPYGSHVRVRIEGNPFDNAYDVFVDQLIGDQYVNKHKYNSMSDDYAYTNARNAATALYHQLERCLIVK
jgi:hypothetical protein